jgi:hypothetical protein
MASSPPASGPLQHLAQRPGALGGAACDAFGLPEPLRLVGEKVQGRLLPADSDGDEPDDRVGKEARLPLGDHAVQRRVHQLEQLPRLGRIQPHGWRAGRRQVPVAGQLQFADLATEHVPVPGLLAGYSSGYSVDHRDVLGELVARQNLTELPDELGLGSLAHWRTHFLGPVRRGARITTRGVLSASSPPPVKRGGQPPPVFDVAIAYGRWSPTR